MMIYQNLLKFGAKVSFFLIGHYYFSINLEESSVYQLKMNE